MRTEEELYTWIEDYLAGELKGESLAEFENRLKTDSDFARQVELHRNLEAAFRDPRERELADHLKKANQNFNHQNDKKKIIPFWKNPRVWAVAAAAVILVLVWVYPFQENRIKDAQILYAEYHQVYPAPEGLRSENNDLDSVLSEGYKKYNAGEYESAFSIFSTLLTENPNHTQAQFYAGLSQFELRQPGKAISYFQATIDNSNSPYISQAKWYMALAYLKQDNKSEAKKWLRELTSANGRLGNDARKILGEMGE